MKILFVCSLYHPHIGGIETIIRELSSLYVSKGHKVVILTKKWPQTLSEYDQFEGIEIYRTLSAKTKKEFSECIDFLKKNNDSLKADIIHVIGVRRPLPLIGYVLSRYWKVPLVVSIAGGDIPDKLDPLPGKIWRVSEKTVKEPIKRSDLVTVFSKDLSESIKQIFPGIKNIKLLYAGLNLKRYEKITKFNSRFNYIVSVRRLDPSKGVDLTIKAFSKLTEEFPKLKLIIVGEGNEEHVLKNLSKNLGLDKKILFLGRRNLYSSLSILKGAILTVVPSRSEGGGMINIEAQACGCPVLASRVGGIPEYVKDGYSGILFKPEDVDDISDKIRLVITNSKLRSKLRKNGKKYVRKFSWDKLCPQYLDLYNTLNSKKIDYRFKPWSTLSNYLWTKITE